MLVAGSDFYSDMPTVTRADGSRDVLIAYYEAGLSPAEVLQTTTINAAKALQIEKTVGILKKGMKADLVIFNGDLENNFTQVITHLQSVMKNGQLVNLN